MINSSKPSSHVVKILVDAKINTTRNTCCCQYHIEYAYYYDTYIHILHVLHNTLVQECSTTLALTLSRDFIHSILCRRTEGCTFYQRPCIVGHAKGVVEWNFWTNAYM